MKRTHRKEHLKHNQRVERFFDEAIERAKAYRSEEHLSRNEEQAMLLADLIDPFCDDFRLSLKNGTTIIKGEGGMR